MPDANVPRRLLRTFPRVRDGNPAPQERRRSGLVSDLRAFISGFGTLISSGTGPLGTRAALSLCLTRRSYRPASIAPFSRVPDGPQPYQGRPSGGPASRIRDAGRHLFRPGSLSRP